MRPSRERIYVKVNSDFDTTGHMQPRSIIWSDGRIFPIDTVRDFRPSDPQHFGDCYTVMIRGEEKHLFYEPVDTIFSGRYGRWFVEKTTADMEAHRHT